MKTFLTKPLPSGFKLQVLATQPYYTVTQKNCAPKMQVASALVANIPSPTVVTDVNDLELRSNGPVGERAHGRSSTGRRDNCRLSFGDSDRGNIIPIRLDAFGREHAFSPDFNPAIDIVPVTIPESVSTNLFPESQLRNGRAAAVPDADARRTAEHSDYFAL